MRGGDFCAGTKSPYVRYSRFRRLACWRPFVSPETTIFIAFSRFSEIGNFWRARPPPPTIFYLIWRSPPSKTPKSAQKIAQHGGQIVPFFLTPIFVVFLGHFWPKNAKPPWTLISVVPLLSPQTTIFPVFFCPCIQKKRRQTSTRGDQIPFLYLPR